MKPITVRGLVFSALFAGLLVVFSYLTFNFGTGTVPYTLENIVAMMAGAFLGAQYGFISMFLVVFLTAVGVPMLHGTGGWSDIVGGNGGYVVGWMFCALFTGMFVTRVRGNGFLAAVQIFVIIEVFGGLLDYVFGVPWLAHAVGLSFGKAMAEGCYPFLLVDAAKALVTTILVVPIRQVYPISRLIGQGTANVVTLN